MKIRHKRYFDKIYVFVNIDYNEEFSLEFLNKENRKKFIDDLKGYVLNHFNKHKEDYIVLAINGILIGTVATSIFFDDTSSLKESINQRVETQISSEYKKEDIKDIENETIKNDVTTESLDIVPIVQNVVNTETNKPIDNVNKTVSQTNKPVPPPVNKPVTPPVNKPVPPPVNTGVTIKLNDNGTIKNLNLEDYVIGVVSSEMPASFNVEALKAQAVAARTFAMKKTSENVTLVNSTTHQVYKSQDKLKAMWGTSYNTYYSKVSNAVNSTKGLVIKSGGKYIDALYHSISNGKTELPKYVWGNSLSYLQSVNSSVDKNVKNYKVDTNFTYNTLSSKLGTDINKNTSIEVLSKTISGRVDSIKINNKIFTGVKIRTLLGLRSTDFAITKNASNATITTYGYGHGVGMSQYGANEMAKSGISFKSILTHYYSNVSIVNI